MRICTLYGKIAQSKDKKKEGTILCALIGENSIEGYICFDKRENEFFISAKDMRVRSGKITFTAVEKPPENLLKLRFGLPVINFNGEYSGKLCDMEVKDGVLKYAICGRRKIPSEDIVIGAFAAVVREERSAETCAKDMFINVLTSRTSP